MKYMGDYPSKKARTASVFFTDQIFTGPVNYVSTFSFLRFDGKTHF